VDVKVSLPGAEEVSGDLIVVGHYHTHWFSLFLRIGFPVFHVCLHVVRSEISSTSHQFISQFCSG
jgi:hypothetical protein